LEAYNKIFDKLILKYSKCNQQDIIKNNILDKNKSPYKSIWNYNEQIIELSVTYKITGQWGISLRYYVPPQLAIIASGGRIRDHKLENYLWYDKSKRLLPRTLGEISMKYFNKST